MTRVAAFGAARLAAAFLAGAFARLAGAFAAAFLAFGLAAFALAALGLAVFAFLAAFGFALGPGQSDISLSSLDKGEYPSNGHSH